MKVPIDVIYVNEKLEVIDLQTHVRPGRIGKLRSNTHSVIELPAGTAVLYRIQKGHLLKLSNHE
ncbi:DUF192 domain-containing protein [Alteribacillus sp. HJP-4]|uniref:DUF192 domain-containing protein n=1 Tax=Alteribacillus sp. HJP-4 TaxID=2775394 RepID=UPI0035CD0745